LLKLKKNKMEDNSEENCVIDENFVPDEIIESTRKISLDLLPEKSRNLYLRAYENFEKWKAENNIGKNVFTEETITLKI
ncbi:hypothetical protein Bhyg_04813, partial [Pseudolycoriella hygida]